MRRYISYALGIFKGRIAHKKIPLIVTLCVTNRCNLKCVYCYQKYHGWDDKEYTTNELLDLINELAGMGTRYISLNGGEALLRKDIDAVVDKVRSKNILCHISTNGLLIKDNIPVLRKVDSVAVSIDGAEESNDLNRGAGVHKRIIEAIEYLIENRIKFHTHTVLTKNNKNAVNEMMALAQRYGFRAQFSTLRTEIFMHNLINLDENELRDIVKKILEYERIGMPVFFSRDAYENILNWPFPYDKQFMFTEAPKGYNPVTCYLKRFSCHIEANGLVYPCIVLVNKFKALNFREVGFKKAWENLTNNECKGCYNVCCNDFNLIFRFKPSSLWNACRIVANRIM